MNKVFLYLYPIEEYTKIFLFTNDEMYDVRNIKRPMPILDECIEKRYRNNGYQVVFVLYPDKEIFGLIPRKEDKIIYTDITFEENNAYDINGREKENFIPKYPNTDFLLNQIGRIDELIIGGYHFTDCVKRVGEEALALGINTTIDLDMTDLFFSLYKKEDYFRIGEYNPKRYQEYWQQQTILLGENKDFVESQFKLMYDSPVYRFYPEETRINR